MTITARDGLALPPYLTLPVGIEPSALPVVLLVHGGPWFRDSWGFDPEVQMLANRGYAVLQVNFPGSIAYGKSHTQAAIGEFAGAMQIPVPIPGRTARAPRTDHVGHGLVHGRAASRSTASSP
ncbi:alpha/beta hydrolase family protein [Streptomyces decoyicus]